MIGGEKKAPLHFGVLSFKGVGHLNPLVALSLELLTRGHKVTFFQKPDLESRVRKHGLNFYSIGTPSSSSAAPRRASRASEVFSSVVTLRAGMRRIVEEIEVFLRETPGALIRSQVDILILDEIALAGPTLAEMLSLPYFVISTSVPHHFGWSAPRRIAPARSCFVRIQDALMQISIFRMKGPIRIELDKLRRQAGLGSIREMRKVFPEIAHITQLPECLDFPRSGLPSNFYYTGPFVSEASRQSIEFPWGRLDGRPLIYASLGTTLKAEPATFHLIAEACKSLNVQLVISLGGRRDPEMFHDLPRESLVVKDAPQLELLKRAHIVITHAGSNTVFETLMEGKPMIALPKAFDQPAIAARLEWLGVAEVLRLKDLSATQIRAALMKVLNESSYREAAKKLQTRMRLAQGLNRAADVIEATTESVFTERGGRSKVYERSESSNRSGQHSDDGQTTSEWQLLRRATVR